MLKSEKAKQWPRKVENLEKGSMRPFFLDRGDQGKEGKEEL